MSSNAVEALAAVETAGCKVAEGRKTITAPFRFSEGASVNDGWRQGDLYIKLIDKLPADAKRVELQAAVHGENPQAQLAPGNTQGSRHILDSLDGVEIYTVPPWPSQECNLAGPILVLHKERTITHPEHGHVTVPTGIPKAGKPTIVEITYQRDLDAEERARRVID
jgi:hypothetical protein